MQPSIPIMIFLLASPVAGLAATFYVSPTGDDTLGGTSLETARRTAGTVLASLSEGDVLVLLPGVYAASNQGAANMAGWSPAARGVSVVGGDGVVVDYGHVPSTAHGFILDEADSAFTLSGIEFRGFRSSGFDNVVRIAGAEAVTVEGCDFRACGPRPAIRSLAGRRVTVRACRFEENEPDWGARVDVRGDDDPTTSESVRIEGCTFNAPADLASRTGHAAGLIVVDVDDLVLDGNWGYNAGSAAENPANGTDFVTLRGCRSFTVTNNRFQRYLEGRPTTDPLHNCDGFVLVNCAAGVVRENFVQGAGHGFQITGNTNGPSRDIVIEAFYADSTFDDAGVAFADTEDIRITRSVSHYAQNNGFCVMGTRSEISRCTIVRSADAAIEVFGTADDVVVLDNLILGTRRATNLALYGDRVRGLPARSTWDHNVMFDFDVDRGRVLFYPAPATPTFVNFTAWQSATGLDVNGRFADPMLENPAGRALDGDLRPTLDFCPGAASPARGAASDGGMVGALDTCASPPVLATVSGLRALRNPTTAPFAVRFTLPEPGSVWLRAFDVRGRLVADIINGDRLAAATHDVTWEPPRPGVFFVRLRGPGIRAGVKLVTRD